MQTPLISNHLKQNLQLEPSRLLQTPVVDPINHQQRIKQELKALGVSRYGLLKLESRYLPKIIHKGERLKGVVYGRNDDGSVMLVSTDRRILFIDRKPLFVNEDEITFDVVSGVSFSHIGIGSTITLHTRIKDFKIRTLNTKSAENFVRDIESRCLEHLKKEQKL